MESETPLTPACVGLAPLEKILKISNQLETLAS